MSQPSVGKDVDAWCSKCGFMLAHTIEAMVGDTIKRVHCNTCGGQHVYRAHAPGEGSSTTRSKSGSGERRRSTGAGMAKASDYQRYLEGRDLSTRRPYSPKSTFAPGELVEHPKFGLGVVTGIKDSTKIELLFEEGPKVLIHGR